MYYPDLSIYEYLVNNHDGTPNEQWNDELSPHVLNVGWLETAHAYQTGDTTEEFMDALFGLCCNPCKKMRGFHICSLCIPSLEEIPGFWPSSDMPFKKDGQTVKIRMPKMLQVSRNGISTYLGHGEIRVPGARGISYAAPTMIYHYVQHHRYLPPAEFVAAVMSNIP